MKLRIDGTPATKKNSMRIVMAGGKPKIIQSERYKAYAAFALCQLRKATARENRAVRLPIDYPVNVKCVYYMPTARRVDLTNLLAATMDILVDAHILADDNAKIVVGHDGSRVKHREAEPRVEIEIMEEST